MQPYGKKKLGSSKIHPHNECGICSEQKIQKGTARQRAKREVENKIGDYMEQAKFKFCPKCSEPFSEIDNTALPVRYQLPADSYQCSKCREVFLIKQIGDMIRIKALWRHVGGGTMMVEGNLYPSDDEYARGSETISITCTTERHFDLPLYLVSLSQLIVLDGISPESKEELRRLIEG